MLDMVQVVSYISVTVVTLLAAAVLWAMFTTKIDFSGLLNNDGAASLSRFQFLIFTFVIAFGYVLLIFHSLSTGKFDSLPDVSNGALGLMGISAGSYALGKGIQTSGDVAKHQAIAAAADPAAAGAATTAAAAAAPH
jgi:hypothetical protein